MKLKGTHVNNLIELIIAFPTPLGFIPSLILKCAHTKAFLSLTVFLLLCCVLGTLVGVCTALYMPNYRSLQLLKHVLHVLHGLLS